MFQQGNFINLVSFRKPSGTNLLKGIPWFISFYFLLFFSYCPFSGSLFNFY